MRIKSFKNPNNMIKKSLFLLLLFVLVKLFVSCDSRCGGSATYENIYNNVTIKAFNTAGFQSIPVEDSVFKNTFGLTISMNFETNQVARNKIPFQSGFSSAMALECTSTTYLYPDPLDIIEIYVVDTKTQVKQNVSRCFGIYGYGGNGTMTLEEFFEIREEWHDGFQLDLLDYKTIPDNAVFIAEAFLESGLMFTAETPEIHFKSKLK